MVPGPLLGAGAARGTGRDPTGGALRPAPGRPRPGADPGAAAPTPGGRTARRDRARAPTRLPSTGPRTDHGGRCRPPHADRRRPRRLGPDTTANALKGGRSRARRTSVSPAASTPGSADTADDQCRVAGLAGLDHHPPRGAGRRRAEPRHPRRAGRRGPRARGPARRHETAGRATRSRTRRTPRHPPRAPGAAPPRCPPPPGPTRPGPLPSRRPSPGPTPRPPPRRQEPRGPLARATRPVGAPSYGWLHTPRTPRAAPGAPSTAQERRQGRGRPGVVLRARRHAGPAPGPACRGSTSSSAAPHLSQRASSPHAAHASSRARPVRLTTHTTRPPAVP